MPKQVTTNDLYLKIPKLAELGYRKTLLSDPETMSYNIGFGDDINGCIDFDGSLWDDWHNTWTKNTPNRYYAYIIKKDGEIPIGDVAFRYDDELKTHIVHIIIEAKYRGKGYSKEALRLLLDKAFFESQLEKVSDNIPASRKEAIKLFEEIGFKQTKAINNCPLFEITKEEYLKNNDFKPEVTLTGGSINKVTRIGDVIYRTAGDWIPAVHKVLEHLTKNGFTYSPVPIGIAPDGREMLNFMPGEPMMRPWKDIMFSDNGLIQAAKMLRSMHDITKELEFPEDTKWRFITTGKNKDQIIRHGDLGPWNTIWQGDKLTGLIDWDMAEPGDAITDLAQLISYFTSFGAKDAWERAGFKEEPDYRHRLNVILEAYDGGYTEKDVILALDQLQSLEISRIRDFGSKGMPLWDKWLEDGEDERTKAEQDWLHNKFPEYFKDK
ncbi:MAG: GNAT family N-acetyltransferase [Candidatus Saccharibacteria bacterium]